MAIIQASIGLLFLFLAVVLPRYGRYGAAHGPAGNRKQRWFSRVQGRYRRFAESRATAAAHAQASCCTTRTFRPPCGEDPMLWKERFTRMGGGLKWLGSRPVALFFLVLLCCYLGELLGPRLR